MAVSFEKNALVLRFETSTPEFAHKMIYAGLELLKEWQIAKPE